MTLFSLIALALASQTTQPAEGAAAASAPAIEAGIELDDKLGQRIYRARAGDCEIRWTIQLSRAQEGSFHHAARCNLPIDKQVPLIEAVLDRLLKDKVPLRSLWWGRIDPDGAPDHIVAARLALAAKKSKEWNLKTGRGAGGNDNKAVRTIANQSHAFTELDQIFVKRGLNLEVRSVEKVLVLPAKKLPFFDQLKEQGVAPTDRLPFDAQISFAVQENQVQ